MISLRLLLQTLLLTVGLSAVWYAAAARLYHEVFTFSSRFSSAAPTLDKATQYGLLLTLWIVPWLGAVLWRKWLSTPADATPVLPTRSSFKRGFLSFLAVFLFSIAVHQKNGAITPDLTEDGPRLASASAVLDGEVPYRDFALPYGPLQEVAKPLLAFRFWGETYDAYLHIGPWLSAIAAAGLLAIMAVGARRLEWTLLFGLILLLRSDWWVPDRLLLPTMSVFFLCRSFQTFGRLWAFVSGLLAFAAFEYSADIGIPLMAGIASYFFIAYRSKAVGADGFPSRTYGGFWIAGVMIAAISFLVWLATIHSLGAFVIDSVRLLVHRQSVWSDGLPSRLFEHFYLRRRQDPWTFAYIHQIPFLAVAVVLILLIKKSKGIITSRWHHGMLLASIVFFQFLIYIGRSDFTHWKTATPFVIPLAALTVEELASSAFQPFATAVARSAFIVLALLVAFPFGWVIVGRNSLWASWISPVAHAPVTTQTIEEQRISRLGALPSSDEKTLILKIIPEIWKRVPKDGYFYDFSNQGVFYFLTRRRNPTRFAMVDELADPSAFDAFKAQMAAHPPQAVLVKYDGQSILTLPALYYVRDYFLAYYRFDVKGDGWAVMVRNSL